MSWLMRLLGRNRLEREMDKEMGFHLDAAIADHMRAGLSRDEAVRRARIDFGGPEQMKEATRDARGTRWVEDFFHDCRFAVRGMRRSPVFATAAVLTIAIGVGANTAVWSIMEALLRRALPVERPETLHAVKRVGLGDDGNDLISHPLLLELQKGLGSNAIAAVGGNVRAYATITDRPDPVRAQAVSGNYFDFLGVRAAAGRVLSPADDRELAASPVVVISHDYWQNRFGGDTAAVGKQIRVNGFPVTIVGVAQPQFGGLTIGDPVEIFAPLAMHHALRLRGSNQNNNGDGELPWIPQAGISWLTLVTRAGEGQGSVDRVTQLINRPFIADRERLLASADSATRAFAMRERLALDPIPRGFSSLRSSFRDPLRALLAGVALVLLITCANLAGLVLARGEARSHEMAIRASLGALSGRLARQLAAESLTLAFVGGLLGVVFAQWMIGALLQLASSGTRAVPLDASLNGSVLLFAFGVTILAGLIVGVAPVLRVRGFELYAAFKTGGRVQGGHRLPLGRLLVAAQIALALILVTSAGVFARTLSNILNIDAGFARETVVTAHVDLRPAGYTLEQVPPVHQRLLAAAQAVPGVQSAALAMHPLGTGQRRTSGFSIPGRRLEPNQNIAQENFVTPGYFRTVGIAMQRGRDFTAADVADGPGVIVVNEKFAKYFFGTTDVIGKRIGYGTGSDTPDNTFEIIGVVRDTRANGLRSSTPAMSYHPLAQGQEFIQSIEARVSGRPEPVIAGLRNAIASVDPNLPVREIITVGDYVERSLSRERLVARLASGFGILALILAAIGLYGVISYSVARRTNEMGVRLALGASPRGLSWLVLRDSLVVVIIGLVAGVALWYPVLGLTRTMVVGLSPHDPTLLAASIGVLMLVGVIAALIPAFRAARIDPIEAIRAN